MTIIPAILALVLAFHPIQSRFTIVGSVREDSGETIASIRVTLLGENYQTVRTAFADSSGRFQFRNLGEGIYTVRVESAGTPFEESSQTIELQTLSPRRSTTEEPFSLDFRLKRKAQPNTITGVIFVQDVPSTAKEQYKQGQRSFKDKKPEPGIQALKKAIEIFPDYFAALELLGTEYVKNGQHEQALPVLLRAAQVNPNASKSFYALGVAYLKTERSVEAIHWLERAAERDPRNPNVYMMMGIAYGNIRSLPEAEEAFKKAAHLGGGNSDVADVHYYLAVIYNKQNRYSKAVNELELYLKEAKAVKDKAQIRQLIDELKSKIKTDK